MYMYMYVYKYVYMYMYMYTCSILYSSHNYHLLGSRFLGSTDIPIWNGIDSPQ